jgi:hypothetical protein
MDRMWTNPEQLTQNWSDFDRFRWVACQIETLHRCLKPSNVRKALISLPGTLDATYERSVQSIEEMYVDDVMLSMKLIVACFRPLQLREIAEALVVDYYDVPHFHPSCRMAQPIEILSICAGFVARI